MDANAVHVSRLINIPQTSARLSSGTDAIEAYSPYHHIHSYRAGRMEPWSATLAPTKRCPKVPVPVILTREDASAAAGVVDGANQPPINHRQNAQFVSILALRFS